MKKIALLLAMSALSTTALADYQYTLNASTLKERNEYPDYSFLNFNTREKSISGTYYIDTVSTKDVPYRLASFLGHNSSLTIGTSRSESDDSDKEKANKASFSILLPETDVRIGGSLIKSKAGSDSVTQTILGGGWYPVPTGLLSLSFVTLDGESGAYDVSGDAINIGYSQAIKLDSSHVMLGAHYQGGKVYRDPGANNTEYSVITASAAYYPTQNLGVEFTMSNNYSDYKNNPNAFVDGESTTYSLSIGYDFSEDFGIDVSYSSGSGSLQRSLLPQTLDFETQKTAASLTMRF